MKRKEEGRFRENESQIYGISPSGRTAGTCRYEHQMTRRQGCIREAQRGAPTCTDRMERSA